MNGSRLIYVVDDDATVRMSLVVVLTSLGYRVRSFESAEEFLGAFPLEQEACLISDYRLKGRTGLQLLEDLKKRQIKMPAILITAYPETLTTERALNVGAVAVLEKPCQSYELEDAIRKACQILVTP